MSNYRYVPPVLQKLVLSVPFLHGWQRSSRSRSKNFARRCREANASPGRQPEGPGRSLWFGHQQHPKPENQDSQHMLNRHRGSFPEIRRTPQKLFMFMAFFFSGLQKGPAERGHVKKRQKSSKNVKKFFDTFRQFSRRAKNVKNRQKVSKIFSTLFDNFRAAPFFRPLLGGSDFCFLKKLVRGMGVQF